MSHRSAQTFVFFGIVGSGKGTQVKLLCDFLKARGDKECAYIGTGEIFRNIVNAAADNDDTKTVKELLLSGRLIPDDMTNKIVTDNLRAQFSPDKNLIFDGYPRTVPQSKHFEGLMKAFEISDVKVIYIELSQMEAMRRNFLRGRADDTEEGLAKRFDEYVNNVVPAMDYFKGKAGYTIYAINGEQGIEEVHQEIISKLGY